MWAKASAGIVPGFFLSAALIGLLCWLPSGPWQSNMMPGITAFFPLWIGVFCTAFRFNSARLAWGWLGALAIAATGLLWSLQLAGWVR